MIVKTRALVVKEYIVGESDKYVTLFTKEYGKIQALAPKAKKNDRGFASGTQLFVYGDFILSTFKDTYRLINVDIIEMFHNLREDLETLSYASYIMEFIQYVAEPNLPQVELLKLTLRTLKTLMTSQVPLSLIRRTFEIRALKELGFMLQLSACGECGIVLEESEAEKYYFSASMGGLLCQKCSSTFEAILMIGYATRYTIAYIQTVDLSRLYHFTVTPKVQQDLNRLSDRYVAFYIDYPFKTVDFIERIEAMK